MHLKIKIKKLNRRVLISLAVIWTVIVVYLSLVNTKDTINPNFFNIKGLDKVVHIIMYTIFSYLWCLSFSKQSKMKFIILIFSISFGVLMEFLQFYMANGRSFELQDILANTFGSFIGCYLFSHFIN